SLIRYSIRRVFSRRAALRLLVRAPSSFRPRRRALPGTKIRRRIEQRINDSGHYQFAALPGRPCYDTALGTLGHNSQGPRVDRPLGASPVRGGLVLAAPSAGSI